MSIRSAFPLILLVAAGLPAQNQDVRRLAPYVPSPDPIVRQMLTLGELRPGELHFDLGSGDGRIVLAAASLGARSVGFEIDPKLVDSSRHAIRKAGLSKLARIEKQDLYTADFRQVDLITTYLLPVMLKELVPILEQQMKPGSRLVSHDYPIPGWTPEKTESGVDASNGLPYRVFLYRR
ncbi:MAG: 50S ribosomal protein L11 methyltransferase [Bryobacterales bacterium]|nr:50S ribosomal protein L11 methyltransferase [Acidobacteriota bacterium]MCB9383369.1 50S ribosomal protein L11 methyltransferase [Bryobacterales bacterium]